MHKVGKLIDQPPERIVVGNGAAELIKIVSGQISNRLIVPVPSFNEYVNAAPQGSAIEFPLEWPSFQLDVDKFAAHAIKAKADVAVVVTPNNPTSIAVPKHDLVRLAEKLANHDCQLIIYESFIDFTKDPDQFSMEDEIEQYPNITIFKSMSKAYGICGIRKLTEKLCVDHNMYIKHCLGKTLAHADRFIRIASRTEEENTNLVDALASILGYK